MHIRLSGYQGPGSVHTRGLHHLADGLSSAEISTDVTENVTAAGTAAKTLFDLAETEDAHITYMASGYLTERVPALAVLDLPMTAPDRHDSYAALDGKAGAILSASVAQATEYCVLGFWDNGVRHISNRARAIRTVGDCRGLVIRTLDNQLYQDTLQAFGFEPVVTDVRDLVDAVASGKVDAQENPITNTLNFGLHEYHRHLSLTGHISGVALLVCRAAWFRSLPEQTAAAILRAAGESTRAQRAWAIDEDRVGIERLKAHGVQVIDRSELDIMSFRKAATPVLKKAVAQIDRDLMRSYFGDAGPLDAED
jgi:TRAP-type transport system periplasmic protein